MPRRQGVDVDRIDDLLNLHDVEGVLLFAHLEARDLHLLLRLQSKRHDRGQVEQEHIDICIGYLPGNSGTHGACSNNRYFFKTHESDS